MVDNIPLLLMIFQVNFPHSGRSLAGLTNCLSIVSPAAVCMFAGRWPG